MLPKSFTIEGKIVDVLEKRIYEGELKIKNGKIEKIIPKPTSSNQYILPGLIDAHVHIESSMLIPSEFARVAAIHGTVATVSDPHEIANVLGPKGVNFMIENGKQMPFKFYFGAPSCVPASPFETSGAEINAEAIEQMLRNKDIYYLAEMMNFPGVLGKDQQVMEKIEAAKKAGFKIDGHAPGLKGKDAQAYAKAGISTDHECFSIEEAEDKVKAGIKIQVREGSAAKNFDTLAPLIDKYPSMVMLCSDDKHPDDLIKGHMNLLIKRGLKKGLDLFNILRSATVNPIEHYGLNCGLLREGDDADFIITKNLEDFVIDATYIKGQKVAEIGNTLLKSVESELPNKFYANNPQIDDIKVKAEFDRIKVIEAYDGSLITSSQTIEPHISNGEVIADTKNDVLKIVVLNRYRKALPSIAFIKNFGLKEGAIASTVAHDSHNIIAVGADDESIIHCIHALNQTKGGISVYRNKQGKTLPLPVAGLMAVDDAWQVSKKYLELDTMAKEMGSKLSAPFMTLSFMALLVIPELKISDKGLFDGTKFAFTTIFSSNT